MSFRRSHGPLLAARRTMLSRIPPPPRLRHRPKWNTYAIPIAETDYDPLISVALELSRQITEGKLDEFTANRRFGALEKLIISPPFSPAEAAGILRELIRSERLPKDLLVRTRELLESFQYE